MPTEEFYDFRKHVFSSLPNRVDLSFINPSFQAEEEFYSDFFDALSKKSFGYQGIRGSSEARLVALNFWRDLTNFEGTQDNLMLSYGTKDALHLFLSTFCLPGQRVFLQTPVYPGYLQIIKARNLEIALDFNEIDAMVLSAPLNPTGQVDWNVLQSVCDYLDLYPFVPVFLDCTYAGLSASFYEFCKRLRQKSKFLIESYSLSKGFGAGSVRGGIIYSSQDVISLLLEARSRLDYGVSCLIETFLTVILGRFRSSLARMKENFEHKRGILKTFGLDGIVKSEDFLPFVWLEHDAIDKEMWERLAFNGFLTIWGGFYISGNPCALRVSLTVPEVHLARFCQILKSELINLSDVAANNTF